MEIADLDDLKNIILALKKQPKNKMILKFTADWCAPCRALEPILKEHIEYMKSDKSSVKYYEINIDETIDVYVKFKKMKMVNGIPAIFYYDSNKTIDEATWFIPHDSVLGGNKEEVNAFIKRTIYN